MQSSAKTLERSPLEKELEELDAGSPTEDFCLLTNQDSSIVGETGHFYCGLTE